MNTIDEILQKAITNGTIHGAVCGIVSANEMVEPICVGVANHGLLSEVPMAINSIFDVASVTKTVPVSTLALMALDRGMVALDTPLTTLLPEYASPQKEEIFFRHLLTQTLDFDFAMSALKDKDAQDIWEHILKAPLHRPAGSHYFYCNATSLLLGRVVENLFGASLDTLAQKNVFAPLAMDDTAFRPLLSKRMVATENDAWRDRVICGEIHDESSWKLNEIMIPGAAGVFTTVPDLQNYLQMIVQDGTPLFSKGFLDSCITNHLPKELEEETALGFEYNQPYMGLTRSPRTIGKTGFTGSVIVADYERKKGFVLLTDFTWPKRKATKEGIVKLRQEIADAVWSGAVE